MIYFLTRKEHIKEKEEHRFLKGHEANQESIDSSLNTIMIKSQKKFFESKAKRSLS